MQLYPEVQRKAQEELDRVVGTDRLPRLADRPNLPYIEAIIKEVLRWNPVSPLGTTFISLPFLALTRPAKRPSAQVSLMPLPRMTCMKVI